MSYPSKRLVQLLQSLNKKEIKAAKKFISSPFHNPRKDVIQLFEYLTECLFVLKITPSKEQIFRHIYLKKTYNDHQVRVIMSFLFKALERFLTFEAFWADPIKTKIKLAEVYRQKQLPDHFQRIIHEAQLLQENNTSVNDFAKKCIT